MEVERLVVHIQANATAYEQSLKDAEKRLDKLREKMAEILQQDAEAWDRHKLRAVVVTIDDPQQDKKGLTDGQKEVAEQWLSEWVRRTGVPIRVFSDRLHHEDISARIPLVNPEWNESMGKDEDVKPDHEVEG